MKFLTKIKNGLTSLKPTVDEAEITIFNIKAKIFHKTYLPVPNEVSVYIPRLEITNKVTEGNKTTETTLVLNSLTIVSAPRHEQSEKSAETVPKRPF